MEALLTFTKKIKIKSEIVGVVDSNEFTVISNIELNAITHGSSFQSDINKTSHSFGILFIEQC